MSAFRSWGFGKLQPFTFLVIGLPRKNSVGLISNVLLANLPQFLLSVLYMLSNTVLSTFLVQREFSHMCQEHKRKPLRVSEPIGIQRGSYFISLPLRYGVPLYVMSSVLHWTISESLFLAKITSVKADGSPDPINSFSACAYSPIAIFTCKKSPVYPWEACESEDGTNAYPLPLAILLALLGVLVLIGTSFRRYEGTMRMVSTNSMAISATCHAHPRDRQDGYSLPVRWAVVKSCSGYGHCAFTTAPADQIRLPKASSGLFHDTLYGARDWPPGERTRFFQTN